MKRIFIALRIVPDKEMLKWLMHAKKCLANEKIRWIGSNNLHLTLAFLGDTKEKIIPGIIDGMKNIAGDCSPLLLLLSGLGIFGNISDPGVLWIGVHSGEELARLKSQIDQLLVNFGYQSEKRKFRPHLTIARIKSVRNTGNLMKLLSEYKDAEFQRSTINEVIVYESILKQDGPEYIALYKSGFLSRHVSPG